MMRCSMIISFKTLARKKALAIFVPLLLLSLFCGDYLIRGTWTKLTAPGVIVRQVGGLGNQLFVYACMYSLAKKMGVPLYLEIPSENIFDPQTEIFYNPTKRPYVLHKFRVFYDKVVQGWYPNYWPFQYPVFSVKDRDLLHQNEDPLPKDKLILMGDYCQSEVFFKNYSTEIKEMFQLQMTLNELARPPFRFWIDLISDAGEHSVAIHIRRGDYAEFSRNANYWITPFSFYHSAIEIMLEKLNSSNVSFFVFSDGMKEVKEELLRGINLPANVTVHFVSCNKCTTSLEDFYLMTMCRHMINANSTYSWWAAYLIKNTKKIIIAPSFHPKTFLIYGDESIRKFKKYEMSLFYPKEWIVLNPFFKERS